MILGVVGKGGSGKSTVSTLLIRALAKKGTVLGIDADHNMDLTYNFGNPEMNYIGGTINEAKKTAGISPDVGYKMLFDQAEVAHAFSLSPKDPYTEVFTVAISDTISLMSAGPQTDAVLYDQMCSHSLFSSLKLYLPLLEVKDGEYVVVDEKAGADGVTTGIVSGFDCALIVCESAEHSVKVANQIAQYVKFFDVPYEFIVNKYNPESPKNVFLEGLTKNPLCMIPLTLDPLSETVFPEDSLAYLKEIYGISSGRMDRTRKRLQQNALYRALKQK
jgi:CO dehydrogenase maturation factor